MKLTTEQKMSVFLALYVAAIVATNLVGGKLTVFMGKSLSVAILALPIAYVVLNASNEVFGGGLARRFILSALAAQVLVLLIILAALQLPAGPREIAPGFTAAYTTVFQLSGRIVLDSIVAFLIGQYYTVWMFNIIKRRTHGRFGWLRYNLAGISGQFVDTFLFMYIAFYTGDAAFVFGIALTYFLFKALAFMLSTPFFYAGVRWILVGSPTPPDEPSIMTVQVRQRQRARAAR